MGNRIIVSALGCVAALFAMDASAQYGYPGNQQYGYPGNQQGYGDTVRCESREGRTQRCDIGVGGEARLLRQLSRDACVRGQSWGTDYQGLWVSRGCRAEFAVGYRGNGQLVRCESSDGRSRECAVGRGEVRLVRQLSSARCIEGQTWGRSANGVWVSRGCRAEFQVSANRKRGNRWGNAGTYDDQYGNQYGNPYGNAQALRCESRDERTSRCSTPIRNGARLVRQLSASPCIEGRNWGWDRSGVWVSQGCRAEFTVW